MKTRFLIIIGILIVTSIAYVITLSYYTIHDSSTIVFIDCDSWSEQIGDQCVLLKPEQYCVDWCDYQELSDLGCGGPVLDYIYRHTNLFDEKFDNTFYYRNAMGLPDGVSEKQFEECEDIVHEKRILTDSDEIKIQQISKSKILSKGTGFDLPEDTFTQEDLKQLQQREKELNKIADNPDTLEEKRRQIHLEIQEMQVRLQYPFQTGVSYPLVMMLQEKYIIFKEHRSDLKGAQI